jgi:tape measure domain-containing protein
MARSIGQVSASVSLDFTQARSQFANASKSFAAPVKLYLPAANLRAIQQQVTNSSVRLTVSAIALSPQALQGVQKKLNNFRLNIGSVAVPNLNKVSASLAGINKSLLSSASALGASAGQINAAAKQLASITNVAVKLPPQPRQSTPKQPAPPPPAPTSQQQQQSFRQGAFRAIAANFMGDMSGNVVGYGFGGSNNPKPVNLPSSGFFSRGVGANLAKGFGGAGNAAGALGGLAGVAAAGLGGLAIAGIGNSITRASNLEDLRINLAGVTGSVSGASDSLNYLKDLSNELGLSFNLLRDASGGLVSSFSQFSSVTKGTSLEASTKDIFSSFQQAFAASGLSSERQKLANTAITQIAGKGQLMAEEVFGQLAESYGQAPRQIAESLGLSIRQLRAQMKDGSLSAEEVLPKFAARAKSASALGIDLKQDSFSLSKTRFDNAIEQFSAKLGEVFLPLAKLALDLGTAGIKLLEFIAVLSPLNVIVAETARLFSFFAQKTESGDARDRLREGYDKMGQSTDDLQRQKGQSIELYSDGSIGNYILDAIGGQGTFDRAKAQAFDMAQQGGFMGDMAGFALGVGNKNRASTQAVDDIIGDLNTRGLGVDFEAELAQVQELDRQLTELRTKQSMSDPLTTSDAEFEAMSQQIVRLQEQRDSLVEPVTQQQEMLTQTKDQLKLEQSRLENKVKLGTATDAEKRQLESVKESQLKIVAQQQKYNDALSATILQMQKLNQALAQNLAISEDMGKSSERQVNATKLLVETRSNDLNLTKEQRESVAIATDTYADNAKIASNENRIAVLSQSLNDDRAQSLLGQMGVGGQSFQDIDVAQLRDRISRIDDKSADKKALQSMAQTIEAIQGLNADIVQGQTAIQSRVGAQQQAVQASAKSMADYWRTIERQNEDITELVKRTELEIQNSKIKTDLNESLAKLQGTLLGGLAESILEISNIANEGLEAAQANAEKQKGLMRQAQDSFRQGQELATQADSSVTNLNASRSSQVVRTTAGGGGGGGNVQGVGIRTVAGQEYGASRDGGSRMHRGEDLDLAPGQNSVTYIGGVVREIQDWGEWGKAAVIFNAQLGVTEIVAEMLEVFVQVGQQLAAGTAVGTGGDDIGGVQHTEIHQGDGRTGNTVDPLSYYSSIGVDPASGRVYGGGNNSPAAAAPAGADSHASNDSTTDRVAQGVAIAINDLKQSESFRSEVYDDGMGVATIGYGETREDVVARGSITEPEAAALLSQRLVDDYLMPALDLLPSTTREALTPGQIAAIGSFTYNAGIGGFQRSDFGSAMIAGDVDRARQVLPESWINRGTDVEQGLRNRRARELEMFNMQGSGGVTPANMSGTSTAPVVESTANRAEFQRRFGATTQATNQAIAALQAQSEQAGREYSSRIAAIIAKEETEAIATRRKMRDEQLGRDREVEDLQLQQIEDQRIQSLRRSEVERARLVEDKTRDASDRIEDIDRQITEFNAAQPQLEAALNRPGISDSDRNRIAQLQKTAIEALRTERAQISEFVTQVTDEIGKNAIAEIEASLKESVDRNTELIQQSRNILRDSGSFNTVQMQSEKEADINRSFDDQNKALIEQIQFYDAIINLESSSNEQKQRANQLARELEATQQQLNAAQERAIQLSRTEFDLAQARARIEAEKSLNSPYRDRINLQADLLEQNYQSEAATRLRRQNRVTEINENYRDRLLEFDAQKQALLAQGGDPAEVEGAIARAVQELDNLRTLELSQVNQQFKGFGENFRENVSGAIGEGITSIRGLLIEGNSLGEWAQNFFNNLAGSLADMGLNQLKEEVLGGLFGRESEELINRDAATNLAAGGLEGLQSNIPGFTASATSLASAMTTFIPVAQALASSMATTGILPGNATTGQALPGAPQIAAPQSSGGGSGLGGILGTLLGGAGSIVGGDFGQILGSIGGVVDSITNSPAPQAAPTLDYNLNYGENQRQDLDPLRLETQVINNVEYASIDQVRGMVATGNRQMAQSIARSPSARNSLGIKS